ncbi:hypothetical protein DUI87_28368 [Hirundo rustica rustica]|uniref:Uncharacterized protein n=1 Tax=Hirundo rustica rustica TaxID=333673 RepID=A0A3M0J4W5_HIRRU|nr:hypothetical protein DUI87_28368 [Hirundo rustica rustica]
MACEAVALSFAAAEGLADGEDDEGVEEASGVAGCSSEWDMASGATAPPCPTITGSVTTEGGRAGSLEGTKLQEGQDPVQDRPSLGCPSHCEQRHPPHLAGPAQGGEQTGPPPIVSHL